MRLQLVNSPIDSNYSKSLRTGVYPPLNIAVLAGYLKKQKSNVEIELLDGEIEDIESIKAKLNSNIVGISSNILTYNSALEIAKYAKMIGSTVVLGGPYPTTQANEILLRNEFVDYIVKGDGEKTLLGLSTGTKKEEIPNLVYKKNNKVFLNKESVTNIEELVVPDYLNLPLEKYFENFRGRYSHFKPFRGSLPLYSIKGCKWRNSSKGGCLFCVIPNKGYRMKQHNHFLNEILYFNEIYGINSFWEVSDSLLDDFSLFEELKKFNTKARDINLHIYGRANQLQDIERVRVLKDANVFEVFIGAESGDNTILSSINKGSTVEQTYKAIENLNKLGIKSTVSFVLGLPGETIPSLSKTLDFAEKISKFENVFETSTSIMLPIPGSKAFEKLKNRTDITLSDNYNLEYLKEIWISEFTNVGLDILDQYFERITSLFPLNNTFSQPKSLIAPCC